MAATKKPKKAAPRKAAPKKPVADAAQDAIAWLESKGTKAVRDGMARFAIPSTNAVGVPMAGMKALAKRLGRDHALALALWESGIYEARTVAALVDEPAAVTPAQMDRWCGEFDSWAICDTCCFHLFDRTPHAFAKVEAWSERMGEFEKRAAFALLASLALHGKGIEDAPFARCLPLVERAARDERNFVKKAVSWALRGVGARSVALHAQATDLAARLAASADSTSRWIGKDAARDLARPVVAARLARRSKSSG